MYEMNDLVNSLKDFPAMPNVIMRALNVMKDPESGIKELAKIIGYDQSLSTKVLTLVNSAYYGFSQQITSINRALSLIGMSKTQNLILTVAMRPMLMNHGDKELWRHSIMTAVGCEYLAKYLKIMDVDEAFVIGFLHDLGKVVLNMKDPKLYEQIKGMASTTAERLELEQTYFGINHCQMGNLLTKRWQLPLLINNATKYHHTPNLSPIPVPCTLVYLVDTLVKDDFKPEDLDPAVMKNLTIQLDQPEILKESIVSKAEILLNELST